MTENIFTPRVSISMLLGNPGERNKQVCTKIPYRGFEISIAMDSSHGEGDLSRSDIRVYNADQADVTGQVLPQYAERGVVPATAESLRDTFAAIDLIALADAGHGRVTDHVFREFMRDMSPLICGSKSSDSPSK